MRNWCIGDQLYQLYLHHIFKGAGPPVSMLHSAAVVSVEAVASTRSLGSHTSWIDASSSSCASSKSAQKSAISARTSPFLHRNRPFRGRFEAFVRRLQRGLPREHRAASEQLKATGFAQVLR